MCSSLLDISLLFYTSSIISLITQEPSASPRLSHITEICISACQANEASLICSNLRFAGMTYGNTILDLSLSRQGYEKATSDRIYSLEHKFQFQGMSVMTVGRNELSAEPRDSQWVILPHLMNAERRM